MSTFSKQEIKEMIKMFLDEGMDNLQTFEDQLKIIERDNENSEALVEIYRILHSFKGMAATIGFKSLEDVFHEFEDLISEIQDGRIKISKVIMDELYDFIDLVEQILERIEENKSFEDLVEKIRKQLDKIKKSTQQDDEQLVKYRKMRKLFAEVGLREIDPRSIDFDIKGKKFYKVDIVFVPTIRLKLARLLVILKYAQEVADIALTDPPLLDILDGQIEDAVTLYIHSDKPSEEIKKRILMSGEIQELMITPISADEIRKLIDRTKIPQKANTDTDSETQVSTSSDVKVDLKRLEQILELLGELLIRNKQLERKLERFNAPDVNEILFQMQQYMFTLQDVILEMQLIPISTIFRIYPRMIRKLAKNENKKVKMVVRDHGIKIDRKMIGDIQDMLNHILRNAVYHGIEPVEERKKKKKEETGLIVINATVESNVLIIKITDDGAGIDPVKIADIAMKKGLIAPDQVERLSVEEIINLIFKPQFSSAESVNKVSGRGLGLNIVKEKLEQMGGSITVETDVDVGTTFTLYIPLLKSLIRALLVKIEGQVYCISLDDIYRLDSISASKIRAKDDYTYILDENEGVEIPLYTIYGPYFPDETTLLSGEKLNMVYLKKGTLSLGLIVDEFMRETEIVIKNIEGIETDIKGIMGAAILDDRTVSLIIDPFSIRK